MELKRVMDNVYWGFNGRKRLVSLNMTPSKQVYGEELFDIGGKEYREWNPFRSKISAALYKGAKPPSFKEGDTVLYLGASSGTTVSHVSDVVSVRGRVYAVEISEEMGVSLVLLSESRKNIFPIIGDARRIEEVGIAVPACDFLYQDIAQRDQTDIFIKNVKKFLKPGGEAAIALKAMSIDVYSDPRKVIMEETKKLSRSFRVVASIGLYPYQKGHSLVIIKKG